ncbi:MAG: rhodanese-like domain-containing protein [Gammaproteobacteria bacterium]|nr:rhodanese-like domain-containing protein [Gammaproteobacteria bacterium]NNL06276.1 rhodanese-like domain-containing protein [Gammaproteobacteria bacterium]
MYRQIHIRPTGPALFHSLLAFMLFLFAIPLSLLPPDAIASEKPFAPNSIDGVMIVSAEQAIDLILDNPDMPIIDSRKKTEYVKGHIEGAVSILNTEMTVQDLEQIVPDRDSAILFYCNGIRCLRSSDAIRKARSWGYTNLIWFRGGWKEWTDKHLPVVAE